MRSSLLTAVALAAGAAASSLGQAVEVLRDVVRSPSEVRVGRVRKRKSYWSPKKRTNSPTYFAPDQRNGARERSRRMRQMAAGTHGYRYHMSEKVNR